MPDIVLKAENLTKKYGSLTAVADLSLEVCEGEVFGFLGPNGAGKTTSIHMMCGLLKPDAGRVLIHGKPVDSRDGESRSRVGVCPQAIVLWERLTCIEQLEFIGQMYGMKSRDAREQGDRLLADLDLVEKRDQQARTLSGGMQRRLNLAMALVHDPEIVVLDEPEAGLDPQSRVKVREYIQSLARRKTVILTTHNMDEADRVADRIAIIDHGKLLVQDTPQALKQRLGGGDTIEIHLKGFSPEAAGLDPGTARKLCAALEALPGQIDLNPDRGILIVRALNVVGLLPGILEALAAAKLECGEIHLRENSLEDVFIQLTGRRLRE